MNLSIDPLSSKKGSKTFRTSQSYSFLLLIIVPTIMKQNPIGLKMWILPVKTPVRRNAEAMPYQIVLIPFLSISSTSIYFDMSRNYLFIIITLSYNFEFFYYFCKLIKLTIDMIAIILITLCFICILFVPNKISLNSTS